MKDKHAFYMGLAYEISNASYAQKKKVGCLIVKDNNIIAFGYNGTPSGFTNKCENSKGLTIPEVLHAESNAIAKCAQSTQSSSNSSLYVTVSPCFECAKLIIQAGIESVYYLDFYHDLSGLELLTKAGITTEKIEL